MAQECQALDWNAPLDTSCSALLVRSDFGAEGRDVAIAVSDGELPKPPRPIAWLFDNVYTAFTVQGEEII